MFRNILVPLDGSPRAELALPVAARLAQASGGTVVLLQVFNPPEEYVSYVTLQPIITPLILATKLEEARHYLNNLTHSGDLASVHTETEVMQGEVAANILSLTDARHINLIVMSSHGYTGMTRWVMGSVAEKVARYAPVPVLIVRKGKPLLAATHAHDGGSLRALVPLDGSARSETAIAPAAHLIAALAAPGRGALYLTQVVIMPGIQTVSRSEQESILHEAKENLSATVEEIREGLVADYGADLQLSITWSVTIDDDIAAGIVRVAENGEDAEGAGVFGGCDVIAMATHGYSGLQRWALGSITERVLHATRLPLLIVRPPDVIVREHRAVGQPMETALFGPD
jgi:nucleotide-binding universal stress UspA family protein